MHPKEFQKFADDCPWAVCYIKDERECLATHDGAQAGICSPDECGLIYMMEYLKHSGSLTDPA